MEWTLLLQLFGQVFFQQQAVWLENCLVLLLLCFIEIPVFNANSVDPDQTPHSAASYRGLHCLPITLLGVSPTKTG